MSVGEIKNLDKKETSAWSSLASFTSSSTDLGRSDISMKVEFLICSL